jgi:GT2 family glycosyltransferase
MTHSPPKITVVISVHNGAAQLERCLGTVTAQRADLHEVIVVDDGSTDRCDAVARAAGCRLIRLDARRGISGARNAGAREAAGDVVAFIDADTTVEPGWAAALGRAFADGATLAGGAVKWPEPRTLAEWYQAGGRWHDETARNGFLPFVSGAHFVIRRDVFLELGGFDELLPLAEDLDLSLRAQLAGYSLSFVPEAGLVHWPRTTVRGLLKQRLGHARGRRFTETKFREFPFLRMDRGRRSIARMAAASTTRLLLTYNGTDRRRLTLPLLAPGVMAAYRLGRVKADLQFLLGLAPLPPAFPYRDPEQQNTAAPLPGSPTLLLLGDDRLVLGALRLALENTRSVIVAPPGLEREALARWDEPAPWSLRLARRAVREGWPMALEPAALRLEREQPRTWGEAFLTMHRVHAWAHERPGFGIAARGAAARRLAGRLAGVPIILAGDGHLGEHQHRVVLRVTRGDLRYRRFAVHKGLMAAVNERPPPPPASPGPELPVPHRNGNGGVARRPRRAAAAPSDPIVFVGGSERSGTTLLRNMLTAHPTLALPNESPFVYRTYRRLARQGQAHDLELAWRVIRETDRFRQWELPASEVQQLLDRRPPASYGDLVRTLFTAYAGWRGKQHAGDKTTGNALWFTWLAERFPGSRFVHIVRDPREVCMSRVVQTFNSGGLPGAARHWRDHVAAARAAAAVLGGRMLELRYEELVSDPGVQLERLCGFIGIPFDPAMLDYGLSPDVIPQHGIDVHAREPLQDRLRPWRSELSKDDVSLIEFVASDLMDEVGYPREVRRLTPGAARMLARERAQRAQQRWLRKRAPRLGQRLRRLRRAGETGVRHLTPAAAVRSQSGLSDTGWGLGSAEA